VLRDSEECAIAVATADVNPDWITPKMRGPWRLDSLNNRLTNDQVRQRSSLSEASASNGHGGSAPDRTAELTCPPRLPAVSTVRRAAIGLSRPRVNSTNRAASALRHPVAPVSSATCSR